MEQEQIRAMMELSVEAAAYIQDVLERGADDPAVPDLLDDLRQIAVRLETEMGRSVGLLQKVCLYARNIQASVDEIRSDASLFERIFTMEVCPFVLEMNRLWHLATDVLPDAACRERYQQGLMRAMRKLHGAPQKTYPYDATIVVCGYNKLAYTKAAVESIFAHTDFSAGRVELITINNGSDDGTREYFERLPHAKKINLKYNILGFDAAQYNAEGRYYIGYSNDVVATPHWLEHLLAAMESDERVAHAVPACNEESISNLQGIPVPYPNTFEGLARMQAFAVEHNRQDPKLWEQRSQLMPFLSITRTDIYRLGLVDPIYTRAEFVDDDMSTLLRRTGWRQLLLRDTFMHHFGGVTLGADRYSKTDNAIDPMRRVYYRKWGVDAWESRGDLFDAECVQEWHDFRADERVLVLEPRFGALACDFVNAYRRSGFVPHMTAAVFDERYLPDTSYLFDETMRVDGIEDVAGKSKGRYDIIAAGCYLDELPMRDVIADLERLYGLLAPGGMLVVPVRNPGSAYELDHLMRTGRRDVYCGAGEVKRFSTIPDHALLDAVHTHPYLSNYRIRLLSFESDRPLVARFLHLVGVRSSEAAEERLRTRMFVLGIFSDSL